MHYHNSPYHFFSLAHTIAKMNLKSEANRLYLSYLWWIIEPLLFSAVYYLVFSMLFDKAGKDFIVFIIIGKVFFLWFSKSIRQSANSFTQHRGLISSISTNLAVYPLAKLIQIAYKQTVITLVLLGVLIVLGYQLSAQWLWLLPIMLTQFVLILLCGYIAAILVIYARDFSAVIEMGMLALLFLSGVFWNLRDVQDIEFVNLVLMLNPIAFLLDAYRSVFTDSYDFDKLHLLIIFIACSTLFFVVVHFLERNRANVANMVVNA